jgi:hypothetical protein
MKFSTNDDNIFEEGSTITARARPDQPLVIIKYLERIYYCSALDAPDQKHFAYFERELISPKILSEEHLKQVSGN